MDMERREDHADPPMVAGGSLHRSVQNEAAIFGSQIYVIFAIFCSKFSDHARKGIRTEVVEGKQASEQRSVARKSARNLFDAAKR
jgi:hypothetical protein